MLTRFDVGPRLAVGHVTQKLRDVSLGQILDPTIAEQREDVSANAAPVDVQRGRLLGPSSLPGHQAGLTVGEVAGAEFLDRDRLGVELLLLGGVLALRDAAEQDTRLLAGRLRSPDPMRADGEATGPPASAILDEVAALARTEDPQAKPCQIVVPYEIVGCTRLCLIHDALAELYHLTYSRGL